MSFEMLEVRLEHVGAALAAKVLGIENSHTITRHSGMLLAGIQLFLFALRYS